ncbi:MAG: Alkaline phosphatase synthesis transcriptional regulatory protein phoP, two-component system, OmpR [Candidatus Parcubacteria bacterium]|jgi:CheY-like chemotaxis protein
MAKKVLIVDDDLYIRELYEEVLKDAGFDVNTASDGQEGIDKMKDGGYDLILLDVMMPKVDGLGVLKQMGEMQPKAPNGKVILLTNLSHDPVIQQALDTGAASFMIKADLTPDQLIDKVNSFLK